MNEVKIGLIGCGRIAQDHLRAFSKIENVTIQAVSDSVAEKANSTAEEYGCKAYTDYRDMIDSEELKAVVIATPPSEHAQMSIDTMSKGINVFCEKPFALNSSQAQQMCDCARDKNVTLMMASKFRFVEDVVKAKSIIESGLLGRVILFENVLCSRVDMTKRWNSSAAFSGGGVLIDNGTHSVDIARFLLGPINLIQAQFGCQVQDMEVEDTARIYFETRSEVMGTIDLSWSINKELPAYINIYGTEGTVAVGWKSSQYKLREKGEWVVFGQGYSKQRAFENQSNHFISCITQGEKPIILPEDGLESVKVVEKAYESSRINKWLEVGVQCQQVPI